MKPIKKIYKVERGVSLYLALMIVALLLAMILGLNAILIGQLKMVRGMGDSVSAFFSADTGIERVLYDGDNPQPSYSGTVDSASYTVTVTQPVGGEIPGIPQDPNCLANYLCLKSIGKFTETRRAIEVQR